MLLNERGTTERRQEGKVEGGTEKERERERENGRLVKKLDPPHPKIYTHTPRPLTRPMATQPHYSPPPPL